MNVIEIRGKPVPDAAVFMTQGTSITAVFYPYSRMR